MPTAHVHVYALPVLPETHISFVPHGLVWQMLPQQPPLPCTAQVPWSWHEQVLLSAGQQSGQAAVPSELSRHPYWQVESAG